MIEHVVSRLGTGLVEFVEGAAVEIDPPPKLNIGDTVQIQLSGVMRVAISWMKWTDREGVDHLVSYNIDGCPIK